MKLPDWAEPRPYQQEATRQVVEAFEKSSHVFLDAPTGSGKTLLGYMVGKELGLRIVYLCTSLSLQDQFIRDFPKAALLKGRSNYATLDKPHLFDSRLHLSCKDCTKGPGDISCDYCTPAERCPYQLAKTEAVYAPLVCTNTAYFLYEQNYAGRLVPDGTRTLVIIDEADTLEKALTGFIELRITKRAQSKFGIRQPKHKTVASSWEEWAQETLKHIAWFLQQSKTKLVSSSGSDRVALNRDISSLSTIHRSLGLLCGEDGIKSGNWVLTDYHSDNIVFKPVRVSTLAEGSLWRHANKWLLMSGTIISSQVMAESLGIE